MEENKINETALVPAEEIDSLPSLDVAAALEADKASAFSSLVPTTDAERATFYNGQNNPTHRIADEIGATIAIRDVFVEAVAVKNPETGRIQQAPRIVLFDASGESHVCVSMGVLGALRKLFAVYGRPTWTTPVVVRVKQINTAPTRKMLTLEVVTAPSVKK